MRPVRVLVVDRHSVFAEALARRLDSEPGIRCVGTAASAAAAEAAVGALGPDIVILDTSVLDEAHLELSRRLTSGPSPVRVVGVCADEDPAEAADFVRAGAAALITKETSVAELIQALQAVAADGSWMPPRLLNGVLRELQTSLRPPNEYRLRVGRLTAREREVLDRMVAGLDRAAIARELFLSVNTVRTHTKNILAKLEAHSSLEAVSIALRANGSPARA